MKLEMLSPERVTELWSVLAPPLDASCQSNEISANEVSSTDIYLAVQSGDAGIIVSLDDDDQPSIVIAVQFVDIMGKSGVEVLALGGKNLMASKSMFWSILLDWFRYHGLCFVDAYANDRMASIYKKKFGFTKSCQHLRLVL